MSVDGQGTQCRRNIAENLNRLSRAHERYRQTDDRQTDIQTDGRQHIANVNSRGREREFTFANNKHFTCAVTTWRGMEAAYFSHWTDRAPTAFHKSNLTHVLSYRHGKNSSKKRQGVKNLDSVCNRISYMQSRVSPCRITKAVVPCQNKIILKNFRPEPPPLVDRPK